MAVPFSLTQGDPLRFHWPLHFSCNRTFLLCTNRTFSFCADTAAADMSTQSRNVRVFAR